MSKTTDCEDQSSWFPPNTKRTFWHSNSYQESMVKYCVPGYANHEAHIFN